MSNAFVPWNPKRKDSPGWITDTNGCDIWQGATVHGRQTEVRGYGIVHFGGKTQLVCRLRYEREVGPLDPNETLDHFVCDNGAGGCCNPHHCRPTSQRENILRSDSISAINAAKTECPNGHPLSGDNLVKSELPFRRCRICLNARQREYTRRKRDVA